MVPSFIPLVGCDSCLVSFCRLTDMPRLRYLILLPGDLQAVLLEVVFESKDPIRSMGRCSDRHDQGSCLSQRFGCFQTGRYSELFQEAARSLRSRRHPESQRESSRSHPELQGLPWLPFWNMLLYFDMQWL